MNITMTEMNNGKRKSTGPSDSKGWKMMKAMGHELGQGLGAESQGRVDIVPVKLKNDRLGLGVVNKSTNQLKSIGDFPRGANCWQEDIKELGLDGDRMYTWSRWTNANYGDQENSLDLLQGIVLPPQSPEAIGPPILEMETQTRFCNRELLIELLGYKNSLESMTRQQLINARIRSNQYEDIKKGIFMNRAAMQMASMDYLTNYLFSNATPPDVVLHFADICAGPGGFSEYITWRRGNPVASRRSGEEEEGVKSATPSRLIPFGLPRVKGYGMTLKGDCDFQLNNFIAGPAETFMPFYGTDDDGDITNWRNLASFANFVYRSTEGKGVHIVMADGGFDAANNKNTQEVVSKQIYLCQCLCALTLLRPDGCFVTKLFDVFTDFSVDLIYLMSHVFKKISIIKPVTSRPANSERYLLCKGLLSENIGMAGCPPAPPSTSCSMKKDVGLDKSFKDYPQVKKKAAHKMSVSIKKQNNNVSSIGINQTSIIEKPVVVDTTSAVGYLIQHFLDVNAELLRRHDMHDTSDVLRICRNFAIRKNTAFLEFIRKSNEEIAVNQSIYLSKLLCYAHKLELTDGRQEDLKKACMNLWKVPPLDRQKIAWPFWNSNMSRSFQRIVGTNAESFPNVPEILHRSGSLPDFTQEDLECPNFTPDAYVGLLIGSCHNKTTNQPLLIFSSGGVSAMSNIMFTNDNGKTWEKLSDKFPTLNPRLPAGSLVWAQATTEYNAKLHRCALAILDVMFLYGKDLCGLCYRKRMEQAREMASITHFPDQGASRIIVPNLVFLRDLQYFMQSLPILPCKFKQPLPMLPTANDYGCVPDTLFIVNHIAAPWIEVKSSKTGQFYYHNRESRSSIYELPSEAVLSYENTKFYKVPWKVENGFDVHCMASKLIEFDF